MRILIVDDDTDVKDFLVESMKLMDHHVHAVENGYDAIDYVRDHEVDLVYMDVSLPGIDGFQTLAKMREIDPSITGVMMSGDETNKMLDPPTQDGIYVSIAKPIEIDKIQEINDSFERVSNAVKFIYDNPFGFDIERFNEAKILIVDDEKDIVDILVTALEDVGMKNLDTAFDGQEAVVAVNKKHYDVVLTDIVMPELNGIDLMRHVKALSEDTQVIILTGNADKKSAISAVKLGAYDFIEKPFDLNIMARVVHRAVEHKLLLEERKL
ncbi:MAG: response regulator [Deltaproteobacteria bacterium]|nr:response regulator [Candidatus Zymogenaceae bacterium]